MRKVLVLAVILLLLTGCSATGTTEAETPAGTDPAAKTTLSETTAAVSEDGTTVSGSTETEASDRMFYAHVNGSVLSILAADNSSADAFLDLLKTGDVTIDMHDYGSFEKVGPLGTTLPRNDEQITTEPGDVILYQGNQITIYYDVNSWSFTRLGKVQGLSQAELKAILGDGDAAVTFSLDAAGTIIGKSGENESSSAAPSEELPADRKEVLVVYFSATGTTRGVAERIAKLTDADIYEIGPAEPYSDADLNYSDSSSRPTKEQNDKSARPAIASEALDLAGYTTVYIGFPIWWGEEPRIMDTFVESYDFTGITLIPFCTSISSGIGRSGPNMEALAGSGTWLDGRRFSGSVSESDLQAWIESLK